MITIENLTKRYGNLTAVADLSLSVKSGEIYGFLGPNGAGKTTTIKIVVGLLKATQGRVSVCGLDIERQPEEARRRIGYVADTPEPYGRLTGREFLMTMGALYGLGGALREERVREGLALLELEPWADELTESYSHGMKQKLMIISSMLHAPEVLVADEPLVGLDPKSARRLKEVFRGLANRGKAIFISTHILEVAERICDRVGIIMKGRLRAEGSIEELKAGMRAPGGNLEDIFLAMTAEDSGEIPAI